jgi:hypothetical protein
MRVFSYKIVRDFGFAPNPFKGFCTLATCKPQIRHQAIPGDLVVGCGSARLDLVGKVVFAMRVSEKLSFSAYWADPRFTYKRPDFTGSMSKAYGDNIYHKNGEDWVQEDSHHSGEMGVVNMANLTRDTSVDYVLIGHEYVYWGSDAIAIPPFLRDFSGDDLYPQSRSHRSVFTPEFVQAVDGWFESIPQKGVRGRPASW